MGSSDACTCGCGQLDEAGVTDWFGAGGVSCTEFCDATAIDASSPSTAMCVRHSTKLAALDEFCFMKSFLSFMVTYPAEYLIASSSSAVMDAHVFDVVAGSGGTGSL